jgi:hypothetical protein
MDSLVVLNLAGNRFEGSLPPELGSLPALESLVLENNSFTGGIPPELGQLASLRELRLGGNSLTGPVPAQIGDSGEPDTSTSSAMPLPAAPTAWQPEPVRRDRVGPNFNALPTPTQPVALAAFCTRKRHELRGDPGPGATNSGSGGGASTPSTSPGRP